MKDIQKGVEEYIKLRRALGFKIDWYPLALNDFLSFLTKHHSPIITTRLACQWAKSVPEAQPARWAYRLGIVRGFARYWNAIDPRSEIPPLGLLSPRKIRPIPHIYTDEQLDQIIEAAKGLPSKTGLRSYTFSTLFGLLSVSGLRISEALALNREDVDLEHGVLTIHESKFNKTRLVPVHPSTNHRLMQYAANRDRIHKNPQTSSFFVSERGTRLTIQTAWWTFTKVLRQIGLRGAAYRQGPRLHDLRHTTAVRIIIHWYRTGQDVEQQMPVLSTYLGHSHVVNTYWYLTGVPELLGLACSRLEFKKGEL